MHSYAAPAVMAAWPWEWKLKEEFQRRTVRQLNVLGFRAWPDGSLVFTHPFSGAPVQCRVEAWLPGLLFGFADGWPACVLGWRQWRRICREGADNLIKFLISGSHPLRFSPYAAAGLSRCTGRERELGLVLGFGPALLIAADEGMGKSTLLAEAARHFGVPCYSCQGWSADDLLLKIEDTLEKSTKVLLLDEMDQLWSERRVRGDLRAAQREGLLWRAAVHRIGRCPEMVLHLGPPEGLTNLLEPLECICGGLSLPSKKEILEASDGNPRQLQRLCALILAGMGDKVCTVTPERIGQAVLQMAGCRGEIRGGRQDDARGYSFGAIEHGYRWAAKRAMVYALCAGRER